MERSMQIPLIGGCQCGKLRYELSEMPRLVYCCHCTTCQKITASAFSISVVVIEEAFHLTAGHPTWSNAPPTVAACILAGFAQIADHALPALQEWPGCSARCGLVHWTTHRGC